MVKEGYNGVYGNCNNNITVVASPAFVDASAWCNGDCNQADICKFIGDAIGNLPAGVGGVVDARGVVYSDGGPITCSGNPFPQSNTVPVTVLLPPATIQIHKPWILPSNTRISGMGRQTILQPIQGFSLDSTNAMIEMGTSAGSAGVVVEHLKLDGSVQATRANVGVSGIYNGNAQDGSYVDDVNFFSIGAVSGQSNNILTTGLLIDTGAAGSGPYSNLNFPGDSSKLCSNTCGNKQVSITCASTAAIQIRAATRGLHGITTTALTDQCPPSPAAGIYLDASNNTIEDVHNEGFYDAIVVGANAAQGTATIVAGDIISNVTGDYGGRGPTHNAAHICNPANVVGLQSACNNNSDVVTDLSLLQIESSGGMKNGAFAATTIQDDLTTTTINASPFPAFVSLYALGEPNGLSGSSQYTRFTTSLGSTNGSSTSVPTWAVGSTAVGIGSLTQCSTPGTLYSNTTGTGTVTTLFSPGV